MLSRKPNELKKDPFSFCLTICSRRRPALLEKALASVAKLEIPAHIDFSVLVVENDTEPHYGALVSRFQSQMKLRHETEPEPGLTYVRNHALDTVEAMGADWVGGIDDDVVIPQDWLIHMAKAIETYPDTQVFYGNWLRHNHPDEPAWHPEAPRYNKYPTGKVIRLASFNNIAVRADVIAKEGMGIRFDRRFNFIGAEDTDFSRTYRAKGGLIRSVSEALAEETNDAERATMATRLKRAVAEQYSVAVIRQKHDSLPVSTFWNIQTIYRHTVLGCLNIGIGVLALPIDRHFGLSRYAVGRRFLAGSKGVLKFYFGKDTEIYKDSAG